MEPEKYTFDIEDLVMIEQLRRNKDSKLTQEILQKNPHYREAVKVLGWL